MTALLLGVASIGMTQLDAHGLKNKDSFYGKPDSVVGEAVLAKHSRRAPASPWW